MPTDSYVLTTAALNILDQVRSRTEEATQRAGTYPNTPATRATLGIYSGCPALLNAVILLTKQRLAGPSFACGRVLFEHATLLHQISAADDGGNGLAIRWMRDGLRIAEGIFVHDAVRLGVETDPQSMRQHIRRQNENIDGYLAQHPEVKPRPWLTPENAAALAGHPDALVDYRLACQPVHASYLSAVPRMSPTNGTVAFNLGPSMDSELVGPALFAGVWFLVAWRAVAKSLSWNQPDLSDLESAIDALVPTADHPTT